MKKTGAFLLYALIAALALCLPQSTHAQIPTQSLAEYQAKSIWLYKFCQFTTWPQPIDKDKPFVVSILGKLPPGSRLNLDKKLHDHKIVIRDIKELEEIDGSNVVFIASSESHRIRTIMEYVGDKPILTVGDTDGFTQKGVAINFYVKDQSIRFEINPETIKRAKLQLHSQLFQIGRVIRTNTDDERQ